MQPRIDVQITSSRILGYMWHIVWVWSVVMWAVSKWGRYSVGMERSDVGSEQVGAI